MKLSKEQRAALEAAGYKISKSGKTVEGKNGGTIGGINENGKFFAGSQKVMDILRNPPKAEVPKQAPVSRPRSEPAVKPRTPTSSGRGDGKAETVRRAADRPKISSGRGNGAAEVTRRRNDAKPKAQQNTASGVKKAAGAIAAGAAALAVQPALMERRARRAARGPSAVGAAMNPGRSARRLAGGRMNSLDPRNNPYKLD
jgi:hypothetical protein